MRVAAVWCSGKRRGSRRRRGALVEGTAMGVRKVAARRRQQWAACDRRRNGGGGKGGKGAATADEGGGEGAHREEDEQRAPIFTAMAVAGALGSTATGGGRSRDPAGGAFLWRDAAAVKRGSGGRRLGGWRDGVEVAAAAAELAAARGG
ncbi:spidroin-1-like [Phoenix dactylifera]|uniref:Spidroin-1-like n=1 Tax=Phoenix dactylifera TaxID=42345 RepID=A0A8B8ZEX7_PHODC|nr:spidroin-1-like [Phoenix dactylifera]